MKFTYVLFLISLSLSIFSQPTISMDDVTSQPEVSMADVTVKSSDGVYRYYAKGSNEPFTGILYANYPNGQTNSWQEYVNGIGQGKWINYYDNGNYKEIGYYEQNRVEGSIQKFYPNGNLKAEGVYKDWRIRVGIWKYYDENGQLTKTEDYGDKGSINEVKEYYERGDIPKSWYDQILANGGF